MKTKFLLLTVLTVCSISLFAQKKEKDKVLASKIYTIELTETAAKKPKQLSDEISFKAEKLYSKFMTTEHHFQASGYTVSVDSTSTPPAITFSSEGKNPDSETIKWDGTITGEDAEGTAVITTKKGKATEYTFTGTLKAKPGKK